MRLTDVRPRIHLGAKTPTDKFELTSLRGVSAVTFAIDSPDIQISMVELLPIV